MGCGDSKLDSLQAVSLCRGRSDLLADALRRRFALADSHAAYAASLRSLAGSLHRLLADAAVSSPALPLPSPRKGDLPAAAPPAENPHSRSDSGSHIQFHASDDSASDTDSDSPLHSGGTSPPPAPATIYYAKNQPPPPSVSFEQQPHRSHTVQFSSHEPGQSSFNPNYNNSGQSSFNPNYNNYGIQNNDYSNYYGYGGMGGFFEPPAAAIPPPGPAAALPPPPSPPRASAWEFLNPFESAYGAYTNYPSYTPSRSSREVRDEEGIPELEELEEEVVKEAYVDQKSAGEGTSKLPSTSKSDSGGGVSYGRGLHYRSRSSGTVSTSEDEEGVVEKSVAHEEPRSAAAPPVTATRYTDGSMVAHEIKSGFDRAAEAAGEVSKLLEVGKHRYELKSSANRASSKMKAAMTSTSSSNYGDISNIEEDMTVNSRNLSSTLQKLYLWEKKLYEEVRAEEKMRLLLDKNCKRLKHLDEKGAEAHKIDSTRTLINQLSTQMRIAIKVVDTISTKINKLRDEELFLQIHELIAGFTRMWHVMLECHRNQCRAISEAKGLDSIANKGKPTDSHMDMVMEFEVELLRLTANFSDWISSQKGFVKAVNSWLVLCLNYEPEMTADGIAPYSPGRVGAPPIFVICNNWSQAMDRISEKEVVATMQSFAVKVRNFREQSDGEQRQMMMGSGDMERWLKTREKEKHIIQKELDALNKKLVLVPGVSGSTDEVGSLQLGLKQVFEAMENFAASSVKAYEEINLQSEEERSAREVVS